MGRGDNLAEDFIDLSPVDGAASSVVPIVHEDVQSHTLGRTGRRASHEGSALGRPVTALLGVQADSE